MKTKSLQPVLHPLVFHPLFKERVWGGRELERIYGKKLPPGKFGESWEICDRPDDVSIVSNGPLTGRSLRWLMENYRAELLGDSKPAADDRFPLLCKILDAREHLSIQVHPPAGIAARLGGEPKTEMWLIVAAEANAELYAGLKRGVTRGEFERKIQDGAVAECFHRIPVRAGDAMFLPSGRVHAIGAGLVIFEIQQNSDTTYRVFDWNRTGLDGKPRELHVDSSLASIDFNDFEPDLVKKEIDAGPRFDIQKLVQTPLFSVELVGAKSPNIITFESPKAKVIAILERTAKVNCDGACPLDLHPGTFCLIPASLDGAKMQVESGCRFLRIEAN